MLEKFNETVDDWDYSSFSERTPRASAYIRPVDLHDSVDVAQLLEVDRLSQASLSHVAQLSEDDLLRWLDGTTVHGSFLESPRRSGPWDELIAYIASKEAGMDEPIAKLFPGLRVHEAHSVMTTQAKQGWVYSRDLMFYNQDYAIESGFDIYALWTSLNNERSRGFYEKCGLRLNESGTSQPFGPEIGDRVCYYIPTKEITWPGQWRLRAAVSDLGKVVRLLEARPTDTANVEES